MARGGYRPGAGRPKKVPEMPVKQAKVELKAEPVELHMEEGWLEPLEYMMQVINDPDAEQTRRDRMAIAAAPFRHGRAADDRIGKKEQRQEAADRAAEKFAVPAGPKLIVNNR